jgi:hypothetical protein
MASWVKLPEHTMIPPDAPSAITTPNSSRTTGTPTDFVFQFFRDMGHPWLAKKDFSQGIDPVA